MQMSFHVCMRERETSRGKRERGDRKGGREKREQHTVSTPRLEPPRNLHGPGNHLPMALGAETFTRDHNTSVLGLPASPVSLKTDRGFCKPASICLA